MTQLLRHFPVPFFVLALLVAVVTFVVMRRHGRATRNHGHRGAVASLAWATIAFGAVMTAAITLLTYTPMAVPPEGVDVTLTLPSPAQMAVNLLLLWWIAIPLPFVRPVGVAATTLAAGLTSIGIEILQLVLPTGRSASVIDLILNVTGAAAMAVATVYLLRPAVERLTRSSAPVSTGRP